MSQTLGFKSGDKMKRDIESLRNKAKTLFKGGHKFSQYPEIHPYIRARTPNDIMKKSGEKSGWEQEVQDLVIVAGRSQHGSDLGKGLLMGAHGDTSTEIDYKAGLYIENEIMRRCKGRIAGKRLIEAETRNCLDGANYRLFEKVANTWDYPAVVSWFFHPAQILDCRTNLSTHSMILRQIPAGIGAQGGGRYMICLVTVEGTDWVNENGITGGFAYFAV